MTTSSETLSAWQCRWRLMPWATVNTPFLSLIWETISSFQKGRALVIVSSDSHRRVANLQRGLHTFDSHWCCCGRGAWVGSTGGRGTSEERLQTFTGPRYAWQWFCFTEARRPHCRPLRSQVLASESHIWSMASSTVRRVWTALLCTEVKSTCSHPTAWLLLSFFFFKTGLKFIPCNCGYIWFLKAVWSC